ncbi:MAG: hypothetical protein K0U98_16485 [Deltaproteobacteria bacterium]|nr:hypothetical protein [Deltaproteobacteria bacterium]
MNITPIDSRQVAELQLYLEPGSSSQAVYLLADQRVAIDIAFQELEPYRQGPFVAARPPGIHPEMSAGQSTFHGEAWLGGRQRQLSCLARGEDLVLSIEGFGELYVLAEGTVSRRSLPSTVAPDPDLLLEVALGPALLLPLATRGIFGLHASAVLGDKGVIAFAGVSGAGKSTLASSAAREGFWPLIGDDLLPWTLGASGVTGFLSYPQLKRLDLAPGSTKTSVAGPLQALYVLESVEATRDARVEIHSLPPRLGALAMVRHTVSSTLFDKSRLERLLDSAGTACQRVPIRRLVVPRKFDFLPRAWEAVARDLE